MLLKMDFKNAFNSLKNQIVLKHEHAIRASVYPFAFLAYSKPGFQMYGNTIISSEVGTQQWEREAPPLFAETIQLLAIDMQSKIIKWYDYKFVLKDLKRVMSSEKDLRLKLNFAKSELCFLEILLSRSMTHFCKNFQKVWPGEKVTAKEQLVILCAPLGYEVKRDLLSTKIEEIGQYQTLLIL